MEPLTQMDIGKLGADFMDCAEDVGHPVIRAMTIGIYVTEDGEEGVLTNATDHDDYVANIRMLSDAIVLEAASAGVDE